MLKSGKHFQRLWLPALLLTSLILGGCAPAPTTNTNPSSVATTAPGTIPVVAAENFYGDVARQIGGKHVSVTSILSDPNVDPHEYELNVQNAVAVTNAHLVLENGDGYDTWMDKLLSASPNPNRIVLTADNIVGHKLTDNPHYWYSPDNMQDVAQAITDSFEKARSRRSGRL